MKKHSFPEDFVWGTATASYQVEGATEEDGRCPSIWDTFARTPGKVYMNENGSVACDQYHRYKEDILLMKKLGFKSYRFSIAWPRIFPYEGAPINKKGIEYYRNLCSFLHENGMTACATLYHWDLPQYLQDKGGWTERSITDTFIEYAKACFENLGDLVDMWITFNEPYCISYLGYFDGVQAPGHKSLDETLKAIHYVNLAHGKTVKLYRTMSLSAPIGITWNLETPRPCDSQESSKYAAEIIASVKSEVFTDPVLFGKYPSLLSKELGFEFPIEADDMEIISEKIDFIGINYYSEKTVSYDKNEVFHVKEENDWHDTNNMGWPIVPDGLERLIKWVNKKAPMLDIYITENGFPSPDTVEEGRIHDKGRIDYFRKHLETVENLISEGIPLKGYYAWSFIDNYEWNYGYSKRFGIVYCDYNTLERIPKDSAYFLRDVIAGYCYW